MFVQKRLFCLRDFVDEGDFERRGAGSWPFPSAGESISRSNSVLGKMVGSGVKVIVVPVPRTAPFNFCSLVFGFPFGKHHPVLRTVAANDGRHFLGQCVDDRGTDAVQAAGRLVVVAVKLAAGVQNGQHHFQGRLFCFGMFVDGDPAAVVGDGDRAAVLVQRDRDLRCVPVHRFVDRVVDDLPDQVVQPGRCRRRRCTSRVACGPVRGLPGRRCLWRCSFSLRCSWSRWCRLVPGRQYRGCG